LATAVSQVRIGARIATQNWGLLVPDKRKPCSAIADLIQPKPPNIQGSYPYRPLDFTVSLILLLAGMKDDGNDADRISAFSEAYGLNENAVLAAVRAYRPALGTTVH
jgi:hypothetical protein